MIHSWKIPGKTPSLNSLLSWHWTKRGRESRSWFLKVIALCGQRKERQDRKCVIGFLSYRPKLIDTDNLIGGIKALRDSFVKAGWLHDDSPQWCEAVYAQELCKKGQEHTLVEIKEL